MAAPEPILEHWREWNEHQKQDAVLDGLTYAYDRNLKTHHAAHGNHFLCYAHGWPNILVWFENRPAPLKPFCEKCLEILSFWALKWPFP